MAKKKTEQLIQKRMNYLTIMGLGVELLMIIFGAVMIFEPEFSNEMIGLVIGIFILLYAASLFYSFFTRAGAKIYSLNIVFGSILTLIGGLLIFNPEYLMDFVTNCIGLYFIISGAIKLNYSVWLKKAGEKSWQVLLGNSIMLIILGLIIMFNNFVSLGVTRILGIFLIASACLKIADIWLFKTKSKEIIKIFW